MDSPSIEQNSASYILLSGSHAATEAIFPIIARLSTESKIMVLDCGNRFNVFPLAREIRKITPKVTTSLKNISIARAFTCYQVVALLSSLAILPDYAIVLDLLSTFYDENVPVVERKRLLLESIVHLRRLSVPSPVLVTTKPLASVREPARVELENILLSSAGASYQIQKPELKAADITPLWPTMGIG
jgi:hypothetical protein